MKLYELISTSHQPIDEELLNELNLKKALAGAALSTAAMVPQYMHKDPGVQHNIPTTIQKAKSEADDLIKLIIQKWDVSEKDALKIVNLAFKYQKPVFPKAKDILAVIGIESSFDPTAVSGLRKDPAVGLMQVRPKIWGISASKLANNVEMQISTGADILSDYFKVTKNPEDTLHAYNLGLTQFRKGARNDNYVQKFNKVLGELNKV